MKCWVFQITFNILTLANNSDDDDGTGSRYLAFSSQDEGRISFSFSPFQMLRVVWWGVWLHKKAWKTDIITSIGSKADEWKRFVVVVVVAVVVDRDFSRQIAVWNYYSIYCFLFQRGLCSIDLNVLNLIDFFMIFETIFRFLKPTGKLTSCSAIRVFKRLIFTL